MTRAIHEYSRIITSRGVLRLSGRAEIESLIDHLISHLDAIDGDADLEFDYEGDDCDMESYLSDDFVGLSLEGGDDNGIADYEGLIEQCARRIAA